MQEKNGRKAGKRQEGIHQLYEHRISKFHQKGMKILGGEEHLPSKKGSNTNAIPSLGNYFMKNTKKQVIFILRVMKGTKSDLFLVEIQIQCMVINQVYFRAAHARRTRTNLNYHLVRYDEALCIAITDLPNVSLNFHRKMQGVKVWDSIVNTMLLLIPTL